MIGKIRNSNQWGVLECKSRMPCPFCGSPCTYHEDTAHGWRVVCGHCWSNGPESRRSPRAASRRWNRRAISMHVDGRRVA